MLEALSCPKRGIGTKHWFHKWHLKLNLWVVFLCSATLTSPAVFAQSPNKPMLVLVDVFIHSNIFLKRKTPFHSALYSNQKQGCAEISKPEGNRFIMEVITAVPVPPLGQPLPTCVAAPLCWNIALLIPQKLHPLPKELPLCTEVRNWCF